MLILLNSDKTLIVASSNWVPFAIFSCPTWTSWKRTLLLCQCSSFSQTRLTQQWRQASVQRHPSSIWCANLVGNLDQRRALFHVHIACSQIWIFHLVGFIFIN